MIRLPLYQSKQKFYESKRKFATLRNLTRINRHLLEFLCLDRMLHSAWPCIKVHTVIFVSGWPCIKICLKRYCCTYDNTWYRQKNKTPHPNVLIFIHKIHHYYSPSHTHASKEVNNKMITQLTGFLQLLNHNRTSPRLVKVRQRESEDHVRARTYTQTVCV